MNGAFAHDPARAAQRENEPIPAGPLGHPPEFFTPEQRAIWNEFAAQVPEGVLTIADRAFFEMFCRLYTRERAGEPLKAAERSQILKCLSLMGLTPADRSRINAPTERKKQSASEFDQLAAGGRLSTLQQ